MDTIEKKWQEFRELVGAEHALNSLESALGILDFEINAEWIMSVEDFWVDENKDID